MLSFSPNDPVFVHDSRPSAEFSTLGYLGKNKFNRMKVHSAYI